MVYMVEMKTLMSTRSALYLFFACLLLLLLLRTYEVAKHFKCISMYIVCVENILLARLSIGKNGEWMIWPCNRRRSVGLYDALELQQTLKIIFSLYGFFVFLSPVP